MFLIPCAAAICLSASSASCLFIKTFARARSGLVRKTLLLNSTKYIAAPAIDSQCLKASICSSQPSISTSISSQHELLSPFNGFTLANCKPELWHCSRNVAIQQPASTIKVHGEKPITYFVFKSGILATESLCSNHCIYGAMFWFSGIGLNPIVLDNPPSISAAKSRVSMVV